MRTREEINDAIGNVASGEYVGGLLKGEKLLCLDGDFSREQLEKIAALMKEMEGVK